MRKSKSQYVFLFHLMQFFENKNDDGTFEFFLCRVHIRIDMGRVKQSLCFCRAAFFIYVQLKYHNSYLRGKYYY